MRSTDQSAQPLIMLHIGQCADVAKTHRHKIHRAIVAGELPFIRDAEGRRQVAIEALVAWMNKGTAQ